jgi:glyoxylase-like metal-dependent hydrolase (beta-lactamase superfamily II)
MRAVALALVFGCIAGDLASAQGELTGAWQSVLHEDQPERAAGPAVGDYSGLPITEAARVKGHAWSASLPALPEHQCRPDPVGEGHRGASSMRIGQEIGPDAQRVRALTIDVPGTRQRRTIWMDGRRRPSDYAPHTWQGFSTGTWQGDRLVVQTTHMKAGWVRRNGIPYSDLATLSETWQRHGDYLTHVSILEDPIYLAAPLVRSTNWVVALDSQAAVRPCEVVTAGVGREFGDVPHYLPGANAQVGAFARAHNLWQAAVDGGADSALPEFARRAPGNAATASGRTAARALSTARAATVMRPRAPVLPAGVVQVLHVQGNVHLIATPAANVVVQTGDEGVLVVDTGGAETADAVMAAIEALAPGKPIRYVVNTHAHGDHTGGNDTFRARGASVLDGDRPPRQEIVFNGETIEILHQPAAHTGGDVLVFFRRSDVLVTGDLFVTTAFPAIDVERGGSINGDIAALNRIIALTVPRLNQEGGTYVVPGHGRIADGSEVVDYRDMVTVIRDRIAELIRTGTITEEVMAARPTFEYDARYGATPDNSARDGFVYTVYHNLRR